MSNVIPFKPSVAQSKADRDARLIDGFAQARRLPDDVFWLKENAEVLGILRAMGRIPGPEALAPFEAFYAQIEQRLRFFPQYYRFLLSICLDLEDLGMDGDAGARLCDWVAREGLAEAELSDLQRAEARHLLARRGVTVQSDASLDTRLHRFINRSATFALPNKKAAYELTHIVFYLSGYGSRDPGLSDAALVSLEYAGVLAYLDQNTDLLAEICAALRFARRTPSALWEDAVAAAHRAIAVMSDAPQAGQDVYHEYLVSGWAMDLAGSDGFAAEVPEGSLSFARQSKSQGALRPLSECMFQLGEERSADWSRMRGHVLPYLGPDGLDVLSTAEESSPLFEAFFASFARSASA